MTEGLSRGVSDGFPRQRIDVLPPSVVAHYTLQPIIRDLMPVWIGHFPQARNHYIRREQGMPHSLLMWCVAGEGWVESSEGRTIVRAGDVAILPADLSHAYGSGADNPWTIYWFHFVGERMEAYLDLLMGEAQSTVRQIGLDTALVGSFEELIQSRRRGHTREDMLISGVLASRIMICMHALLRGRGGTRQHERTIDRATRFMRENLGASLSLDELAAKSYTSISHLNRLFKEHTGFPPMAYFTQLRMMEACRLLATSDGKVGSVAFEVGYSDPYHFSRVFRRVVGSSPSAYRKSHG